MFQVIMYTDGSSRFNGTDRAVGGWATVLKCGDARKTITGGEMGATNNQMELRAVIEGVKALKRPCEVIVYTDSQYVASNAGRIRSWRDASWKNKSGHEPKNLDLWIELIDAGKAGGHHIKFEKVAAHTGDEENELCDRLAKKAAEETMIKNGWRV